MKGVVLDSSSYGSYEDAKARFKHQALLQDYQELHKVILFVFDPMYCRSVIFHIVFFFF